MEQKYTWATEEIFESVDKWEETFETIKKELNFDRFKGQLGNPEKFLECMKEQERVGRVFEKLSV